MVWSVMPAQGSCVVVPVSSAGTSGPVAVSKPVGSGAAARNLAEDVKTIQDALNQVTVKGVAGGAMPFLAVDGIIGPKTNAAIANFQRVQLGFSDGLIEPNKATIGKLNEILDLVSEADLQAKIKLAVPIVIQTITAALANLTAIISGNSDQALQGAAADRLNRHFLMDTMSALDQSEERIGLFSTYTNFLTAISNPELFNLDTSDEFDLDKRNPKIASVQGLGFFMPGQADKNGRRFDHIHLGLGFFAPNVTPEFGAFIILHEVSHFLGRRDGIEILDFGRGWFNDTFIRPLAADKRLTNADSYATFAHECRVESPAKPGFVQTAPGGAGGAR